MKGRESGMPQEESWEHFFDGLSTVTKLLSPLGGKSGNIVEFGCGYGTFTIPAASIGVSIVSALDIDPNMVTRVQQRAAQLQLKNIQTSVRDFVALGTGLDEGSQSHAMMYNLLHIEDPVLLLMEAFRNLETDGRISVIHWRSDIPTPRGPSLTIRPSPEMCFAWLSQAGFRSIESVDLQDVCPYHFGLVAVR